MKVLDWEAWTGRDLDAVRPASVTVGVFDGVHIGHRALIGRVLALPGDWDRTAVTFRQNPKGLLRPGTFHGAVSSLEQKLESLEEAGIGTCVLIDFSGNFSRLAGVEFLTALSAGGGARYLAIGSDFRCGHRLSTDATGVRVICAALGVATEIVEPVMYHGRAVSSSRIRRAVQVGRLPDASAMLGRPYALDLRGLTPEPHSGALRYHGIRQVLPPPGMYVTEASDGRGWRRTPFRVLPGGSVIIEHAGEERPAILRFSITRQAMKLQGV
ncbi:MAG TPA: FAD synthetase family protein [Magnetospirillaceae bacterium]|nr:FAD synthetase family protein [Magnetospirillaceae bacterium]